MKKVILAMLVALMALAAVAAAQEKNGAEVYIDKESCFILPIPDEMDSQLQAVLTPSGNTHVACNGDLTDDKELLKLIKEYYGLPLKVNVECETPIGYTEGFFMITPSGQWNLRCNINGNDEPIPV
jgi:hypothetical protein